MTVTLIERLIAIHNDPRLKLGWYEQYAIQEAITALKTQAAQVEPAPAQPALPDGMRSVPCAVQLDPLHPQHGWLFIPHVDGQWVSAFKLMPFSQKIIEYWLAAAAQEQTP